VPLQTQKHKHKETSSINKNLKMARIMENLSNINGNNNIVIQGATDSTITINVNGELHEIRNDIAELRHLLNKLQSPNFQIADKIYNINSINEANFYILLNNFKPIPHQLTLPPFLPTLFIGRHTELLDIHQKLFNENNLLLLMNGQGGVGKTTLAAQYYHKYQHLYQHTAWVLTDSSLPDALLTALTKPLQLHFDPQMHSPQRFEILLTALANLQDPCLLVIDNANNLDDLKTHYHNLRRCTNFHLLLTTRITHLDHAPTYTIEGLPYEQALKLFKKHYSISLTEEEQDLFRAIHTAVGQNTLVVELLAKNLSQLNNRLKTRYTLQHLLNDLQKKDVLHLSQSKEVATDYHNNLKLQAAKPEDIIAAMYDLSQLSAAEKNLLGILALLPTEAIAFEKLETLLQANEDSAENDAILQQLWTMYLNDKEQTLALLQSNDIDEATFLTMHDSQQNKIVFSDIDQHLLSLAQKGWIEYNEAQTSFKLSPVVQAVVLHKTPQALHTIQGIISTLIDKLDYEGNHLMGSSYQDAEHYARYAESMARYFMSNSYPTDNANPTNTDNTLNPNYNQIAILCERIGNYHTAIGNLDKALSYFDDAVQLFNELYQSYPTNVGFKNGLAISYSKLGETHSSLGNLDKALSYFEDSNKLMNELYQSYPTNVGFKNGLAISYCKLAQIAQQQNNTAQARLYFEQAATLWKALVREAPLVVQYQRFLQQVKQDLARL
jgi:tetratricopeptide (TPR) repeat protein/type II secretory pathway predicted ATPase ExeA